MPTYPREQMLEYYTLSEDMIAKSKVENNEFTKWMMTHKATDEYSPEYLKAKADWDESEKRVKAFHNELLSKHGFDTILRTRAKKD